MARKKRNDPAANGAEDNAAVDSGAGHLPQNAAAGKKKPKPYTWGACRAPQDAKKKRKAQGDARVKAAALALGFAPYGDKIGSWSKVCPDCGTKILLVNDDGRVGVRSHGWGCYEVPLIEQWLCDNGFGGEP